MLTSFHWSLVLLLFYFIVFTYLSKFCIFSIDFMSCDPPVGVCSVVTLERSFPSSFLSSLFRSGSVPCCLFLSLFFYVPLLKRIQETPCKHWGTVACPVTGLEVLLDGKKVCLWGRANQAQQACHVATEVAISPKHWYSWTTFLSATNHDGQVDD